MARKKRTWMIGIVSLGGLASLVYGNWLSPTARVQRVADRFVAAIAAGEREQVQAMLAPDPAVTADQWLAMAAGMAPGRGRSIVEPVGANPCGLQLMAQSALHAPDGFGKGLTLYFKRVQGQWRVYQGDGRLCPP